MKVKITLGEVLDRCEDWIYFCSKQGYSEWCVAEGSEEHEITLTEEEAKEFGIIK